MIWEWPQSRHLVSRNAVAPKGCAQINYEGETYKILPDYWKWREQGFSNIRHGDGFAGEGVHVRYPLGWRNRHDVKCAIVDRELGCIASRSDDLEAIGYIEGRKRIYLPLYCELVRKQPLFAELQRKVQRGDNIVICDLPFRRKVGRELEVQRTSSLRSRWASPGKS